MGIVYVLPSMGGLGLSKHNRSMVNVTPDYNSLHWRSPDISGMHFAELDSYDMCGLSAIIYRTVPHHRIRYILGAMGSGHSRLSRHGDQPLSGWDYVLIENNESVRTWPLSKEVLDYPLEMIVYCYRDQCDRSQNTQPLRGVNFLAQDDVYNWAHDPGARIGHMHICLAGDLAYSERGGSSDGDVVNDKDT